MKKLFWVICMMACAAGGVRADSVTFTESYSERILSFRDEDFVEYFKVANVGYSGSGSVTFPGLRAVALNTIAGGSISLGGARLEFSLEDEGVTASANRMVIKLGESYEDENGDFVFDQYGTLTFTRSGDVLTFAFSASGLSEESSIAAAGFAEPVDIDNLAAPRIISSQTQFALNLDGFSFTRRVYFKGTASYRRQVVGSGDEAELHILATVSLTGAADYTRPTLSITSPRANQRIANQTEEIFLITGKAADNGEVAAVNVRVIDDEFEGADYDSETGNWAKELSLSPGTNTIEAFSMDADGNVSSTARVTCFRVVTNRLTLIVGDGGAVMGVSNGQFLEIGRGYKATAKPGPTNLFSYWSNSVTELTSTNLMLPFQMEEGLVLEAHFVPNPWVLALLVDPGNEVMGVSNTQVLIAGRRYTATAKPGPTNLFSYWSNSVSGFSSNAVLNFPASPDLLLEAHFIPNPWLPNAGTYNGLFLPVAYVSPTNAGFITLQLTAGGKISGKITQGAKQPRSFTGQVDLNGKALIRITAPPALTLQLIFDLANGTADGLVSNAAWQSVFTAGRQAPAAALVGKHTFAIPGAPAEESTNRPAGDGAGVLKVKANGSATLAGNLGEGAPLTVGSGISRTGRLPVHAVQFGGRGLFIGWLNVSTSAAPLTVTGASLKWFKPPGMARQSTYPSGFSESNKSLMGTRYTPPRKGTNVINWTNGAVLLDGGLLTSTISNVLTVAGTKLTAPGATNQIVLKLTASSGKLSGSFLHPASSKKGTPLNGYVLQMPDGDVGKGWFIRTNESGFLDLHKLVP